MGLLDRWLKPKKRTQKEEPKDNVAPIKRAPQPQKTAKELADERGEPYINVVSMELDPNNLHQGAFELDWNDKFVANLVRAGYQGKTDADMVDQWFADVCKNVIAENYEQWEANQPFEARPRVIDRKDLGGGKTEVS